jgi:hypothetical protein
MCFNEKKFEFFNGKDLPVVITPKYTEAKNKALEAINGQYKGILTEADFWILMNTNKAKDKMLYSGLIISHNGCLKINDSLPSERRFKPSAVSCNEGWKGALTYTYCDEEIFEVGEVSDDNCKNAYPHAMAFKRCFDRVVLKKCKLAYSGIMSDAESEEFREPERELKEEPKEKVKSEKSETIGLKDALAIEFEGKTLEEIVKTDKELANKLLSEGEGNIKEALNVILKAMKARAKK